MPNGGTLLLAALLILTQNVWARRTTAPTTATSAVATTINYQGHLADANGNPLNGTVSLTFAIYDAETGGNVIWGPETHAAVNVQDGLFSVGLGTIQPLSAEVWTGGDRYLEITVNGQTLSPREPIRAVPFAQMAWTVPDGSITSDKLADDVFVPIPVVHEFVRDSTTQIPVNGIQVGNARITVTAPAKIYAQCDMTIKPDSSPRDWVGLSIVATNGSASVTLDDNVYHGTSSDAYTSWSVAGILSLPEPGVWTVQCALHRSNNGSGNPVVHTYSITVLQVE